MLNKAAIIGRIGKEPDVRVSGQGSKFARFSVATDRKHKNGEKETTWHNCVAFGKTAEFIEQYAKKGLLTYVEGEMKHGSYEKDGVKHRTFDIIVNQIKMLEWANDGEHVAKQTDIDASDELGF